MLATGEFKRTQQDRSHLSVWVQGGARVELVHGAVGRLRYDRGLFNAFGAKGRAEKAWDGLGAKWQ